MTEMQDELAQLIDRHTGADGIHPTGVPRLSLIRASRPSEPMHGVHQPALCLLAQGSKQVLLGESVYVYDRERFLVVSVDLPVIGQVIEATSARPYLCVRLDLDPGLLSGLMLEAGLDGEPAGTTVGLSLSPVTAELRDAALRLVRLLDTPRDIPILAPGAEREILYRVLIGAQGARLRQIARADSKLHQVSRAIGWIKRNFAQPFSIEAVAAEACMSPSALHHHFKAVTRMSPLQYQKHLRLQEARRLILTRAMDAATAGHSVGYDSPSQFSREYSRLFGAPPIRDAARLRAAPQMAAQA